MTHYLSWQIWLQELEAERLEISVEEFRAQGEMEKAEEREKDDY